MKKLLIAFICGFTAVANPIGIQQMTSLVKPVAAATCNTLHEQNASSVTTYNTVGLDANNFYVGQFAWDPAANITVCKITVVVTATGTISGNTYTCEIWTYAAPNMGTLVQASAGVAGSDAWSSSSVDFTFSGAAISSGSSYAIVLTKNGAPDASNYLRFTLTASGGFGGISGQFDSAGVRTNFDTTDHKLAVYK